MSEMIKGGPNSGDGLRRTGNTTVPEYARRLAAGLLLAAVGEVRGNALPVDEGLKPTDVPTDGRGDPVIRAFGRQALGLTRIVQPSGERTAPLPTPDQQPPADS